MEVNLSRPDIGKREIKLVSEVLKSGWLSIGSKIEEFEGKFRDYFDVKHAIGVNSGTSGLHLLVKALDINEGDEVITTPFSFVASTNCFLLEQAKPVFVDIDPKTFNIDIDKIEAKITEKTKAILPVDIFGQPVNIERIKKIADKYNLSVIEDSCEAIGSEYNGIKAGTLADGAVFAFYPNKQITTGEGGMIITNDDKVAKLCRSYRSQGRAVTGFWLHHERIGYNYRLSEIHAAIGIAQMERLDEILQKRQLVADMYTQRLEHVDGITIPYIHPKVTRMSWFVYVIQVDRDIDRNKVMYHLKENGVGCRPYFTPLHIQPYIREKFGFQEEDFPIAADIGRRSIALPFYNRLTEGEINYTVKKISEAIKLQR
ncbi:DegT/DnrJ/EryC1/StrS family aminotransferase [Wukongibacter baidiensis]|uniref:DegT/DnrJ/EryC1/StrS family aminotransferase n=1 Tax=Wukongibacter baidiensis TaxID=1723361 RepID=UPI003D7F4900